MKKFSVKSLVLIGTLSGLAYVLMIFKFPLPVFPSFLKIDFSDLPALFSTLILGPSSGVIVELLKNVLDYMTTGSETGIPVGHISNFVSGILFILPTYFVYRKLKTKKGMTIGLLSGTFIMSLLMSFLNYYVFLPAYTIFLGASSMSSAALLKTVLYGILPFNIIKGILMTVVFMLVFVRLHSWIGKQSILKNA